MEVFPWPVWKKGAEKEINHALMVIDVHICCDVSPEYEISSQVVIDLSYLNCSYTYSFNWQIEFFFAEILQFFCGDNAILLLKAEVFI